MSSPAAGGGGAGSGGRSTGGASGNATGGNAGVGGGAGGSGAGGVDKGTPARGDGGAGGNAGEPTHTRGGAGDSSAGGSSEASAGAAGAAGAAGDGPVCEASLEDCDGSTFTPCETDTRSSPLHCGGCARRCSGACHAGSCLEPSTLIEEISLIERGLAHVGQDWYALNANTLCTFKEGQPTARVIQSGLSNMSALEPGPDRLYLGDSTHWWSVSYANPGVLVDEQLEALDVKYMDGGLYWVDRARAVHFKGAASGSGVAYCVLPEAAFEVDSAVLARVGPGAPAVFRRGFGESIYSDVVACPAPDQASLGAPVSGTLIAQGDTSTDAGADAEKFYWNEGNTLFRADASGAKEELFRVPSDESSSRPFVIAGSSLILSFKQDFTAGLFVISLDSSSAPQVIGTFHQPRSLYVDEPSARLCYAEEDSSRVTCFALSELTARP